MKRLWLDWKLELKLGWKKIVDHRTAQKKQGQKWGKINKTILHKVSREMSKSVKTRV